jgi:predicted permease
MVDEASSRGMVNILLYVVTPCLMIDVFQRPFDPSMFRQLLLAFAVAVAAHLGAIFLANLTVRRGEERTTSVLKVATVFSNAGFMGIPLEQAILGEEGVFFGVVYVAIFNLFIWSWGLRTMQGSAARALAAREMFVNPGTVGLAVGLPLFLLSVTLPEVVAKPVSLLADLNTPLAMVIIGFYLAGADFGATLRARAAYLTTAIRLVVFPLLLLAALYPFRAMLDREMMLAMVTAASAPVAAMVTMFSARYERDVALSVGLVSGSTLLSLLTMPVVVAFAMMVLR